MFILLALPVIAAVAAVRRYLAVFAPTNVLIRRVHAAQPNLLLAAVLSAVALMLLAAGHGVSVAIEHGAPGWLHLVVLVLLWDAIKLMLLATSATARFVRHVCRALFRLAAPRRAWS